MPITFSTLVLLLIIAPTAFPESHGEAPHQPQSRSESHIRSETDRDGTFWRALRESWQRTSGSGVQSFEKIRQHGAKSVKVPNCVVTSNDRLPWVLGRFPSLPLTLNSPPRSLTDVFRVINTTELGHQLLSLRYHEGMPKFRPLTVQVRKRKRLGKNTFGAFVPDENTIYLDFDVELGNLASNLFHELVHSLDPRMRGYEREKKGAYSAFLAGKITYSTYLAQLQKNTFADERLAYDAGDLFALELNRAFPCYGPYLLAQIQNGVEPPYPYDDDIIWAYKLDSRNFDPAPKVGIPDGLPQ